MLLALKAPVSADMDHADVLLLKNAANQSPPMAVRGILFAAQQGRPAGLDCLQKPGDAALKLGRLRQPVVQHVPLLVIKLFAVRPASEKIAQEQIVHAPLSQMAPDFVLVELRSVARVGARPDIHDQTNPLLLNQGQKRFQGMI